MTHVVDASVAAKWFIDERDTPEAELLLARSEPLIAPELGVVEVANAMWKHILRGETSAQQASVMVGSLSRFFADLFALGPLAGRAVAIAGALRHPVYDCFYLALAEAEGATLVTADQRLLAAVQGTGWAALCRPLVGQPGGRESR